MGEMIELTAADGHSLAAYRAEPEGTTKGGVVVVQEIFGVNQHIREVADGYAAAGYLAVAPAVFDRVKRDVELTYTPEGIQDGLALKDRIGWDDVLRDVAAAAQEAAAGGRVGVVGYCWGGSVAWLSACRLVGIAAAIGYYGGQIKLFMDEKPAVPTLLHFGERDGSIPLDDAKAVAAAHPDVAVHFYDAEHGFNCDHRGQYDAAAAAQARERSLAHFAAHLG